MTEPALTPEEWKAVGCGEIEVSAGLYLTDDDSSDVLTWSDRKRVAALCLYGQPFGFTREDVERIDFAIADTVQLDNFIRDPEGTTEAVDGLWSLRWRIAALLPPETA